MHSPFLLLPQYTLIPLENTIFRIRASNTPRRPHGRGNQTVRFGILDEPLDVGVPAEFAAQFHGDVAEEAHGAGTVSDFDRGGRGLAGPDALEEVAFVAAAFVEVDLVRAEDGFEQRLSCSASPFDRSDRTDPSDPSDLSTSDGYVPRPTHRARQHPRSRGIVGNRLGLRVPFDLASK